MVDQLLSNPEALLPFILIGFAAQLVDGALGMAYGTIGTTLLVASGVPPGGASAGGATGGTGGPLAAARSPRLGSGRGFD